jgi:hypothetical protein
MSSTRKTPQYTAYGLPSCQSVSATAAAVTAAAVTAAVTAAATAAAVTAAAVTAAAATAAAVTAAAATAAAVTAAAVAAAVTAAAVAAAAGLDFIWVEDPEALARVRHRLTPGGWKRPSKKEGGPMDRPLVWRTADNSAVSATRPGKDYFYFEEEPGPRDGLLLICLTSQKFLWCPNLPRNSNCYL